MLGFLNNSAPAVAPRLLGCILERTFDGHVLRARIVETEAYDQTDIASHSYKGRTPRTEVMFGNAGHLYVYFTYGMHYCCNIVVGPPGHGAAVLLRALEPLAGENEMASRRNVRKGLELTNGPAKLCQALAIDKALNGHDLRQPPLRLIAGSELPADQIIQTTRIGISRGQDVPWRFYIAGNPYVSRPSVTLPVT
jgi:DNA-3-methyladenine glycosylase